MMRQQMVVVVKVQDRDRLQSIQIYPDSSDSGDENMISVASFEYWGAKTCAKIIRKNMIVASFEYWGGNSCAKIIQDIHRYMPERCYSGEECYSQVLLPHPVCPDRWDIVLKFIDQAVVGTKSDPFGEEHCIDIEHPCAHFFPIIREILENLSTDVHWETGEETIATHKSAEHRACEDRFHRPANLLTEFDQYRVETTMTNKFQMLAQLCKWMIICSFQDHMFEEQTLEGGIDTLTLPDYDSYTEAVSGRHHYKMLRGLAKVVMGVSATASCGSSSALAKAAYAAAFLASLTAFWLPCKLKTTTRALTKFGAIACAAGVLTTLGNNLPHEYIWISGFAFLVPAAAVALS